MNNVAGHANPAQKSAMQMNAMQTSSVFASTVGTEEELRTLYREPTTLVRGKEVDHLDEQCRRFIGRATVVMIGTSDGAHQNVSPKGGPAGFVKVIDDHHLAIPDLNGNNRIDGLRDLMANGHVGLLFLIPGMTETLRINGAACVSVDDHVLDLFTDELRRPKTAIGVRLETGFLHCGKALLRGGMWKPETWPAEEDQPSPGEMLVAHADLEGITGAEIDASLADSYVTDLAADQPE